MSNDSKTEALRTLEVPNPASTYQTVVRPHQFRRGDVLAEGISEKYTRTVVIDKVVHGEVKYRGAYAPVLFVYGVDARTGSLVVYTRTSWEFFEVTRIGTAPQFRNANKVLDQFVY